MQPAALQHCSNIVIQQCYPLWPLHSSLSDGEVVSHREGEEERATLCSRQRQGETGLENTSFRVEGLFPPQPYPELWKLPRESVNLRSLIFSFQEQEKLDKGNFIWNLLICLNVSSSIFPPFYTWSQTKHSLWTHSISRLPEWDFWSLNHSKLWWLAASKADKEQRCSLWFLLGFVPGPSESQAPRGKPKRPRRYRPDTSARLADGEKMHRRASFTKHTADLFILLLSMCLSMSLCLTQSYEHTSVFTEKGD